MTLLKALFLVAYTHTVQRTRIAFQVATFPRYHPGGGTLRQWQACVRIAARGMVHPNPLILVPLLHTIQRVDEVVNGPQPGAN